MDQEELLRLFEIMVEQKKKEMLEDNKSIDDSYGQLRESLPVVIQMIKDEDDKEALGELALRNTHALVVALEAMKNTHDLIRMVKR